MGLYPTSSFYWESVRLQEAPRKHCGSEYRAEYRELAVTVGQVPATNLTKGWPRGATPCPRSGVAAERSYPMSEVRHGG